jgi:serine/threonine-protein kinase
MSSFMEFPVGLKKWKHTAAAEGVPSTESRGSLWRRWGRFSRRTAFRLALVIGVTASAVGISTQSAQAAVTLTFHLQDWATGRCLDSNTAGDVYTSPCQSGNNWQTWRIYTYPPTSDVDLQNVATGRWLTWDGSSSTVRTSSSYSFLADAQALGPNWGNVHLDYDPHRDGSNHCLDSNGSGAAYVIACNYGTYQTWRQWG